MADVTVAGRNFDLGFRSDTSRDQLDKGIAYRMRDWIPQNEAPLRKRGGWGWGSVDLNGLSSASRVAAVGWAPFAGDPHLIAVSEGGKIYRMTNTGGGAGVFVETQAALTEMTHAPFWHKDRMILLGGYSQTATAPKKYIVAAPYDALDVGGTPPLAVVGCSWGEYLLLANGTVTAVRYPNRLWWSAVGNSDSWSPTTSNLDMPDEVTGAMLLRNITMVWGFEKCWIITGDTPPPGGNLARRDFASTGCFDSRSIVRYRDYAIWANNTGVWKSDGSSSPTDIAEQGGISLYYQNLMRNFTFSTGWKAAGGLYRGHYVLSVTDSNGVNLTTLVCDIDRSVWFEFTNIQAAMFAIRSGSPGTASEPGDEELLFAHRLTPRVGRLSDLWTPTIANSVDGDSIPVLPVLETPFYNMGQSGLKRIRRAYISYDARTAGGNPNILVEAILSPESTQYRTLTPNLPATLQLTRARADIRERALGVGFRITQQGASADTRLHEIEIEGFPIEPSHVSG